VKQKTFDEKDVEWANETLSFIAKTAQGKIEVSKRKAKVATILMLKRRLAARGFWWQVKRADNWLHRLQSGEFDYE